ncbi:chaplin family protein [Actinomadura sp. GTD37]|uniref:chaplin family protein n=1 Tax=Actinomadura sp. GTD37 TaxID=1778030 RepID=UPI0035C11C94
MRTRAKGISRAAVLAAGFVALGVTAIPSNASADVTHGDGGVLSGNQISAPISAPVNVCGNAAAAAGVSAASCDGRTLVEGSHGSGAQTSGDHGAGTGNQANAPIQAPAEACGNAAAVAGLASGLCDDGDGYSPYSRTTGTQVPLPHTTSPALPNVASDPHILPKTNGVTPAGDLTQIDGLRNLLLVPSANHRRVPGGLPGMDGVLAKNALPKVGGVSSVGGLGKEAGLHTVLARPVVGDRRVRGGLPVTDGVLGKNALSKVDAASTVGDLEAPVADGHRARGGLPDASPGNGPRGGVTWVQGLSKGVGAGKPDGLKVTWLPKVRNGVPAMDGLVAKNARPQVGGAGSGLDVRGPARAVGRQVAAVTGEIGPVRNVAATDTLDDEAGSMWALVASGFLGVVAGALALARRIRLGGGRR